MANIAAMFDLFDAIDRLILEFSSEDEKSAEILERFVFRLFCILDGVEQPVDGWAGVALIAREDLAEGVDEINDDFLHDAWVHRKDTPE